ncbi:MAG: translation initiation factor eIF-1A [Nanoarchaeota archaeon]|nr:translation initiation factor eIF-1A [Nanoarchaeota archaeon]
MPMDPRKKPFQKGNQRNKNSNANPDEEFFRVRTPRNNETLGIVEQRVGGSRMLVKCFDGKQRNCRIPGRLKRKLWVREGDVVLIEPWELSGDEKGDVLFKYKPIQVEWLQKNGLMRALEDLNEF